jgi:hypothetical protein
MRRDRQGPIPMYNISLINMPFAAFNAPSLGLTQLKAVLESQFENRVSVEILYLCHKNERGTQSIIMTKEGTL